MSNTGGLCDQVGCWSSFIDTDHAGVINYRELATFNVNVDAGFEDVDGGTQFTGGGGDCNAPNPADTVGIETGYDPAGLDHDIVLTNNAFTTLPYL